MPVVFGNESSAVVGSIMITDVVTVPHTADVSHVFETMTDKDVRCVVVLDDSGSVNGIVTDSDVVFRAAGRGALSTISVADIMTPDPYCVPPTLGTNDAIRLMGEHGFRRLPVVEDGKLVGLVSIGDIIGAFMQRLDK